MMGEGYLTVLIRASETDQVGRGREFVLEACVDAKLCPIVATTEYH